MITQVYNHTITTRSFSPTSFPPITTNIRITSCHPCPIYLTFYKFITGNIFINSLTFIVLVYRDHITSLHHHHQSAQCPIHQCTCHSTPPVWCSHFILWCPEFIIIWYIYTFICFTLHTLAYVTEQMTQSLVFVLLRLP